MRYLSNALWDLCERYISTRRKLLTMIPLFIWRYLAASYMIMMSWRHVIGSLWGGGSNGHRWCLYCCQTEQAVNKHSICLWFETPCCTFYDENKNHKKHSFEHDFIVHFQYYAHAEAAIPLRRVGTCEDHIVPLIMFMASDKATFINGAVITVDGGYSHTCNCPWICSDELLTYFTKCITLYLF